MLPERNDRHVEEARKLLIGQYRGKPVIQGLLDSFVRRLQDAEDTLWDVIDSRLLPTAVGAQLDMLGALVKEPRRGRSNEAYRVGIRIKIKVLRSKGRIVDIIDVASLANAPNDPIVEEFRHLNFQIEAYSQVGERHLAEHLSSTRAASSYGNLFASVLPPEDLLLFDDEVSPDSSTETFSDSYSGQGRLAAACYGLPPPRTGATLVGDPLALPAPRIDWFEPASGEEGDTVTLHGAFFADATAVDVITFFPSATTPATSFVIVNDARITCVLPPHANGGVGLRVTTPGGTHTKSGFTYVASGGADPPVLVSLDFDLADPSGGDKITISGTDLDHANEIVLSDGGSLWAATIVAQSPTNITFAMPEVSTPGLYQVLASYPDPEDEEGDPLYSNGLEIEAWSPDQLSGIDSYFDSNRGVVTDGSDVLSWEEVSRSEAYVSASGKRPTRVASAFPSGAPAIRFAPSPGAAQPLISSVSERRDPVRAVFFVAQWTSGRDSGVYYAGNCPLTVVGDTTGSIYASYGLSGGAVYRTLFSSGWAYAQGGEDLNDGSARLVGMNLDVEYLGSRSDNTTFFAGTTQLGDPVNDDLAGGTTGWNALCIGYGGDVDGYIGDLGSVVICTEPLSSGDLDKLHKWARVRFGVAA